MSAAATPSKSQPIASMPTGIHATATAIIQGRYSFTPDGSRDKLNGLKVAYLGGTANITVAESDLAKYGDGELIQIACECVDGDRGTLKPSNKWRIVEQRTGGGAKGGA